MGYTVSDEKIIKALDECKGNITNAARMLGISRVQIYDRRKVSPKIEEACLKKQKRIFDLAEDRLEEAIDAGKPWAVMFALSRLGKNEGYSERIEQTGPDGAQLEIIITRADK